MRGHLQKRGKRWYCVFDVPSDDGKRKQKWVSAYTEKSKSEKLLAKLVNEVNQGTYTEPSDKPLRDYLREWLRNKKGNVSDSTYEQYLYFVKHYIVPNIGRIKLNALKTRHIKSFYSDLREKGALSAGSIYRLHVTLKAALYSAVDDGDIIKNPAVFKDAPKKPKKEMEYWDEQDAWKFLDSAKGERTYIAFYLAIKTGMRQGEILGLKWEDIDLEKKTITIKRVLTHDGSKFGTPKNDSKRTFDISDTTIEQLKKHYTQIKIERMKNADIYEDNGLVIPTSIGTPLLPRNLSRIWYRLRKKARVKEIRFHDLRHTHVAISIKSGEQLHSIAHRIGHTSIQQLDETYGHLLPGIGETSAKKFEEHFYSRREMREVR